MNDDPKYISFPLCLIADLESNLNNIYKYGIYRFAKSIPVPEMDVVFKQVIYDYSKENLHSSIADKIDDLREEGIIIIDEHFKGFSPQGEFSPEYDLEVIEHQDEDFLESCIKHWQLHQAISLLGISEDFRDILHIGYKIHEEIEERETEFGRDPLIMVTIKMIREFINESKTEFEKDLFRAFLSIKSIQGIKKVVCTTKEFVLARMIGAKRPCDIPAVMLDKPHLKRLFESYSRRSPMDRLLKGLVARGFLMGKMGYKRRSYFSTHYQTSELPQVIFDLILKNSLKTKSKTQEVIEKASRKKLDSIMKNHFLQLNKGST